MNDSKKIIESFKEGVKNTKKQHLKSCKNRSNSKANINDNGVSGLMLSRIEEFIEIGQANKGINLKDRLLDTCVLKDLKKLFINKDDENNKDNGMFGYTLDNKNKTIIKFNKSPNQLNIEQFIFPDKMQKNKRNTEVYDINNNDSFEKVELNNISENKDNINFIKKFKDNYPSDPEDKKNHKKKVKSNIIAASKNLKNEIRKSRYKNTVLVKHSDFNNILKINSKDKRKSKNNDKEKDINPKEKQRTKKEESKKVKDKDNQKEKNKKEDNKKNKEKDGNEEDNNKITEIRRKKKSKTRKQQKISFHLNKEKISKKIDQNLFNNNIERFDIRKKISDADDYKIEDNTKNSKNLRVKSNKNNNIRSSIKSCYFENDKNQKSQNKKSSKRKMIKFQSVLFPKKKSLFESKNRKLFLKQKGDSNNNNESFYKENSVKDKYSAHSQKSLNKGKNKKQKNQNNIKLFKEDSASKPKLNDKNDSDISSRSNSNENIRYNENNEFKNKIRNLSHYKIKHVNDIFLGNNEKNNEEYKNAVIKIPVFSVVEPDKLIYFEYNRAYERPKNENNLLAKNAQNLINEKKVNENNEEESFDNKINKRNKGLFCCL